jgi:exodeoxyribonuclease V gamma subunit
VAAELARGELPPGELGLDVLRETGGNVDDLLAAAARFVEPDERTADIDLALGDWRLTGTVDGIHDKCVVDLGYSRMGPKQRMRAWIDLLALSAAEPGDWQSVVIARTKSGVARETYGPVLAHRARELLATLVRLREVGIRTPLPVPMASAETYADNRRTSGDVDTSRDAAQKAWESPWGWDGDDREPENCLIWGYEAPFQRLWEWQSPLPLPVDAAGETSDFARIACAVWHPLQEALR